MMLRLSRLNKISRLVSIHTSSKQNGGSIFPLGFITVAVVFGIGLGLPLSSYFRALNSPILTPEERRLQNDSLDLTSIWRSKRALDVDDGRSWDEWVGGIRTLRKELCAKAQGDVLESAAGTGANLDFYNPDKVKTITLVDVAPQLLVAARERWLNEAKFDTVRRIVGMRFLIGDLDADGVETRLKVIDPGTGEVATQAQHDPNVERKFDTIVQSMALCSTQHPEKLLCNLGKLVKQDGEILLLEHGASSWWFINKALQSSAFAHAKKYGCWWDRDILSIVKDSGLKIKEIKRYNWGTTWMLVLEC